MLLGLGADEVTALVGSSEGEGDGEGRGEEEESQRHLGKEGWRSCIELGLKRGAKYNGLNTFFIFFLL